MDQKGFTLTELIIVVAIIGILAMIAVPAYIGQQKKAARTEAYTNLQNLRLLEEQFFAENGQYISPANGTNAVMAAVPGFKPGPTSSLLYDYSITTLTGKGLPNPVPIPYDNSTVDLSVSTTPCCIAIAKGILGTRVCPNITNCDVFAIDCNNNRNF